jgi:hypothetical protein
MSALDSSVLNAHRWSHGDVCYRRRRRDCLGRKRRCSVMRMFAAGSLCAAPPERDHHHRRRSSASPRRSSSLDRSPALQRVPLRASTAFGVLASVGGSAAAGPTVGCYVEARLAVGVLVNAPAPSSSSSAGGFHGVARSHRARVPDRGAAVSWGCRRIVAVVQTYLGWIDVHSGGSSARCDARGCSRVRAPAIFDHRPAPLPFPKRQSLQRDASLGMGCRDVLRASCSSSARHGTTTCSPRVVGDAHPRCRRAGVPGGRSPTVGYRSMSSSADGARRRVAVDDLRDRPERAVSARWWARRDRHGLGSRRSRPVPSSIRPPRYAVWSGQPDHPACRCRRGIAVATVLRRSARRRRPHLRGDVQGWCACRPRRAAVTAPREDAPSKRGSLRVRADAFEEVRAAARASSAAS